MATKQSLKSKIKILMVDDEPDACKLFKKIIEGMGYRVFTATSAGKGLACYKKESPDLVFLDIVMPGTDGISLLKKIIKLNTKQIVIMITGYGDIRSARAAMKLGAYDYVSKPLAIKVLKASIEDALVEINA